jgi:hypothetical protein
MPQPRSSTDSPGPVGWPAQLNFPLYRTVMKTTSLLRAQNSAERPLNRRREIWSSFVSSSRPRTRNEDGTLCCLEKGEVTIIERPLAGELIHCRKGRLWITQTGGGGDIVLTSSESFKTLVEGRLVIEALEDAAFTHCLAAGTDAGCLV